MPQRTQITGSWVAIPTPLRADGSVHLDGFAPLIERQVAHGTSTLLVTGSAGEVSLLSPHERRDIIEGVAHRTHGVIRTFFGTTCATTQDTIALTRHAEACGADGVVLTVPAYSLPTQSAILDYLLDVARSTTLDFAVYNNPARVGKTMTPETLATLNDEAPNFVADKEATADVSQIARVVELTDGTLPVLACDNPSYGLFTSSILLGQGMANITGNTHPAEMAYLSGPLTADCDLAEWKRRFIRLLPLMRASYWLPNPVVIKASLTLLGYDVGGVRRPLQGLAGRRLTELSELLATYPEIPRAS